MGKPIPVQGSPLGGLLRLLRRLLFFRRHRGFLLLFPLIFQFFGAVHHPRSQSWHPGCSWVPPGELKSLGVGRTT